MIMSGDDYIRTEFYTRGGGWYWNVGDEKLSRILEEKRLDTYIEKRENRGIISGVARKRSGLELKDAYLRYRNRVLKQRKRQQDSDWIHQRMYPGDHADNDGVPNIAPNNVARRSIHTYQDKNISDAMDKIQNVASASSDSPHSRTEAVRRLIEGRGSYTDAIMLSADEVSQFYKPTSIIY